MARRSLVVRGIVQGVGFRPFVYHLAQRLKLAGFVRNAAGDVIIEIEGPEYCLGEFVEQLTNSGPPLAQIEEIQVQECPPIHQTSFEILPSGMAHEEQIFVSPDIATCEDCLHELFATGDRRYHYPFLNCTHCGPRLTIIKSAPYDRERTTMAAFTMCADCRLEYENPGDRRFHAQPIACPMCGPQLKIQSSDGSAIAPEDPLAEVIGALHQGGIVALKGLGGYHLACAACRTDAVTELRRRKERDERPFAVMVQNVQMAQTLCFLDDNEQKLLTSPARPIVLLRKRSNIDVANAVAPGNPFLGVMLPYSPLHHLLLHELEGMPLVMTSGNRSDEPIAYRDDDARTRLADIADLVVGNNRPIHIRCDDSVTRILRGREAPLRRSRGLAPAAIPLPLPCPRPTLALGGQQKNTFALGRDRHALMSHHLGDLEHFEAYRAYVHAIGHYERLFGLQPELVVHDLHPDYASSQYARTRTGAARVLAVQHHHAHMAACMAEHALAEPVIGVIFDGTGYGLDQTIWGGEFLVGDFRTFYRAAHFRQVAMAGGEKAIREPWRMALAFLFDCDEDSEWYLKRVPISKIDPLRQMIARRVHSPLTSSAGRLFDAVAALAGVRQTVSYEGQAAIELEWSAMDTNSDRCYPFAIDTPTDGGPMVIDTRPLLRAVAYEAKLKTSAGRIGRRFHSTMTEIVRRTCGLLRDNTRIEKIVCSGGVFMNKLLTEETARRLEEDGFEVFLHQRVPANDGGLSLGQLAIASAVDSQS